MSIIIAAIVAVVGYTLIKALPGIGEAVLDFLGVWPMVIIRGTLCFFIYGGIAWIIAGAVCAEDPKGWFYGVGIVFGLIAAYNTWNDRR